MKARYGFVFVMLSCVLFYFFVYVFYTHQLERGGYTGIAFFLYIQHAFDGLFCFYPKGRNVARWGPLNRVSSTFY